MMESRTRISPQQFINNVDMLPILDEDETPEQYINDAIKQDSDSGCYISNWGDKPCMFFQTAGFEFIFV